MQTTQMFDVLVASIVHRKRTLPIATSSSQDVRASEWRLYFEPGFDACDHPLIQFPPRSLPSLTISLIGKPLLGIIFLFSMQPHRVIRRRSSVSTFGIIAIFASSILVRGGGGWWSAAVGASTSQARGVAVAITGCGLLNRLFGASHIIGLLEKRIVFPFNRVTYCAFLSTIPLASSTTHDTISSTKPSAMNNAQQMTSETCSSERNRVKHSNDPSLWLYHVESTTSTMDEARSLVEKKFIIDGDTDDNNNNILPTSFVISATSQSNGRGTTNRNWKSAQRGNALFTIGVPQSSWMKDLKAKNNGMMVPLTLLPLKVGTLVALHTQNIISDCSLKSGASETRLPKVTVKWPNDVLLRVVTPGGEGSANEKVAGILIESSKDWFLIGIGINVAHAPDIPSEGVDYGRKATCISRYCNNPAVDTGSSSEDEEEEYWVEMSKKLATDIAYDLHSWLHHSTQSSHDYNTRYQQQQPHSGETILDQWKSYIDWDMELTLRDTPNRERVKLKEILEDGRVVVQEVETGLTRTLVSDYFL